MTHEWRDLLVVGHAEIDTSGNWQVLRSDYRKVLMAYSVRVSSNYVRCLYWYTVQQYIQVYAVLGSYEYIRNTTRRVFVNGNFLEIPQSLHSGNFYR